jgi:hypothetical protein
VRAVGQGIDAFPVAVYQSGLAGQLACAGAVADKSVLTGCAGIFLLAITGSTAIRTVGQGINAGSAAMNETFAAGIRTTAFTTAGNEKTCKNC